MSGCNCCNQELLTQGFQWPAAIRIVQINSNDGAILQGWESSDGHLTLYAGNSGNLFVGGEKRSVTTRASSLTFTPTTSGTKVIQAIAEDGSGNIWMRTRRQSDDLSELYKFSSSAVVASGFPVSLGTGVEAVPQIGIVSGGVVVAQGLEPQLRLLTDGSVSATLGVRLLGVAHGTIVTDGASAGLSPVIEHYDGSGALLWSVSHVGNWSGGASPTMGSPFPSTSDGVVVAGGDSYVMKLDSAGAFEWEVDLGADVYAILTDSAGIYCATRRDVTDSSDTAAFGVTKLDLNGNVVWRCRALVGDDPNGDMGYTAYGGFNPLHVDPAGLIWLTVTSLTMTGVSTP